MTDDEIAKIMFREWNTFEDATGQETMKHVLSIVRPYLEARGIELAAQYIRGSDEIGKQRIADKLSAIAARQCAEGGKS